MAKKLKLSDKRKQWVGKREVVLKGKPLNNNVGLEIKYAKRLDKLTTHMATEVSQEIKRLFKGKAAKGFSQDESITSAFRILMNKLSRKYDKVFSKNAKQYAEFLVNNANKQSSDMVKSSFKQLSGGLTINVDTLSSQMKESLKASVEENVGLIKSIKADYFERLNADVLRTITRPDTGGLKGLQDSIDEILTERFKQQKNKAKNVALDQTRKVYNNLNADRMKKAGVSKFQWNHSGGGQNPREDHVKMDGKIYSLDDLPVIDKRTGERGIPGQAINCLPGDSNLDFFYGVKRAFRHLYTGESTEVITDDGNVIKCTPNHPILTDRGLVPARLVNCGDNVVILSDHGINALNGYADNFKTRISEIFDFLSVFGFSESFRSTGGELHGDVIDKNIDVVSSAWELWDDRETRILKSFLELFFSDPDMMHVSTFESCNSSIFKFINGSTLAPHGIVSASSKILSSFTGELLHSDAVRVKCISLFNSIVSKNPIYKSSRAIKSLRDSLNTDTVEKQGYNIFAWKLLSSLRSCFSFGDSETPFSELYTEIVGVAHHDPRDGSKTLTRFQKFSRVVDKRVGEFSFHVYNLEMDDGVYYTQGMAVGNCKCFMTPVIEFDDGEES